MKFSVETQEKNGEVWFKVPDIARALKMTRQSIDLKRNKVVQQNKERFKSLTGNQNAAYFVNKSGYQQLLLQLKIPVALKTTVTDVSSSIASVREHLETQKKLKVKSGHVYLLHNRSQDIAKIGKAIDCRKRWKGYQCPHNWVPKVAIRVTDQTKAEKKLLKYMHAHYTLSNGREFFWCGNIGPIVAYMSTFGENILGEI